VYRHFRLPDSFLSDHGPQFSSQVFREMARLLGIKMLRTMAYHFQTDGETKRINQELEIYFRIFCFNNLRMWKPLNSLMEFSHNQKIHSTMKQTLFYLMMGYEPKDIPLAFDKTNAPTAEQWVKAYYEAGIKLLQHTNWQDKRWQKGLHEALPYSRKENRYG